MYINNNILNYKNKKLILVLKKVYGLNKQQNKYILKNLGIHPEINTNNISKEILKSIDEFVTKNYLINNDLKFKTTNNIKSKHLLNTYKGYRHKNKLPIHGQNTHSNGKTAKKLNSLIIKLYKNTTCIQINYYIN